MHLREQKIEITGKIIKVCKLLIYTESILKSYDILYWSGIYLYVLFFQFNHYHAMNTLFRAGTCMFFVNGWLVREAWPVNSYKFKMTAVFSYKTFTVGIYFQI